MWTELFRGCNNGGGIHGGGSRGLKPSVKPNVKLSPELDDAEFEAEPRERLLPPLSGLSEMLPRLLTLPNDPLLLRDFLKSLKTCCRLLRATSSSDLEELLRLPCGRSKAVT